MSAKRAFTLLFVASAVLGMTRIAWRHFFVEYGVHWDRVEQRYDGVRSAIGDLREIGYVTDRRLNLRPSDSGDPDATILYQQAQYALAPSVLRLDETSTKLVLGNFIDPASVERVGAERRLALVHDFGNGLVLFAPRR